ncbi:MAG: hypothetical protein K2P57_00160 [Burkholderiales bacterium]|nr:hypothetical protein [Burkholderiales bacterium]
MNRPTALDKKGASEIGSVFAVKPVKEATAHAPFGFKPLEKHPEKPEQVFQERSDEERRKYCRRLQNIPVLYELRMENDRRRKNQRKGDITTAIDEMA